MKKLVMLCCLVFSSGLFASTLDFDLSTLTVRANGIVAFDENVSGKLFDHYANNNNKLSDGSFSVLPKKFAKMSCELMNTGYKKCFEVSCNMSITSKFNQLFSRGQKAGCIIVGLVVIPLALYGAYNLLPVMTNRYHKAVKRYREKYEQENEE